MSNEPPNGHFLYYTPSQILLVIFSQLVHEQLWNVWFFHNFIRKIQTYMNLQKLMSNGVMTICWTVTFRPAGR